ncbi:MAG: 2-amino-4-hydroxy-6-hydroxymethyldihydropteridine diphosphokinase [Dysgonamonadaceae bacterium]|jgi:2-amino-4-hydroxy-6-hydroxymethyldihydropteridine diphosphokinase|nr:2-amino-4-hydroxy-6-hydroxymethyldihydropteridine diphosphokinase [Dysgonamonadaceae bacterium]
MDVPRVHTAYLSLGSNLGDKNRNLLTAIALIAEKAGIFSAVSSVYETEPWGYQSPNVFYNMVVSIETTLLPLELLEITQSIEKEMGRISKNSPGYQDRIIDIDIILYDDWVYESEKLKLPHPHFHKRLFVLEPLNEIQPDVIHPVLNKSISAILESESKSL